MTFRRALLCNSSLILGLLLRFAMRLEHGRDLSLGLFLQLAAIILLEPSLLVSLLAAFLFASSSFLLTFLSLLLFLGASLGLSKLFFLTLLLGCHLFSFSGQYAFKVLNALFEPMDLSSQPLQLMINLKCL